MKEKRQDFRVQIKKACTEGEVASNILHMHFTQNKRHPRKEEDQPQLLSTIIDIVQVSLAADD